MERRLAAILAADVVGYSRLMEADEEATLSTLNIYRRTIDGLIEDHRGRVFGAAGDSVVAEFASPVEAVRCAVEIQKVVEEHNAELAEVRRMQFRIGINLGDVMVEGNDLLGDGVNVAARLESLADPGGICISGPVLDQVEGKLNCEFEDLGAREIKNITRPVRVYRLAQSGGGSPTKGPMSDRTDLRQEIRFCTTSDDVQIAYATVGRGPPLVKTANWLNHLEYDWKSPVWQHLLEELAMDHLFVRYDERGNGLSDWDIDEQSLDAWVNDLETVVDTVGLERFALLGISQGCAVSINYAARHPERLTHLVLYGGYARGRGKRGSPGMTERVEALITLIRLGWGQENPAFRQIFTSLFIPGGTPEQAQWFNDLQRISTSPENAARLLQAFQHIDVSHLLSEIATPTLVLHCRDDAAVPFQEGRRMAAMIPGARFVALEGRNHLILKDEPAWPRFLEEVRKFLDTDE
ncbi:MAG: alpha/beta fold hydrolase [Alphaproteobacteria bacterium]